MSCDEDESEEEDASETSKEQESMADEATLQRVLCVDGIWCCDFLTQFPANGI